MILSSVQLLPPVYLAYVYISIIVSMKHHRSQGLVTNHNITHDTNIFTFPIGGSTLNFLWIFSYSLTCFRSLARTSEG